MCTRFVLRGDANIITGFNFDIDLGVWNHQVIVERDRFYIGILRPDGKRHGYHGVHRNGNVGTLLYVHGNAKGAYRKSRNHITVAELTEAFIGGSLDYEAVRTLLQQKSVTYAEDATMQAMLSDVFGRTLIIEPGIGWREECQPGFSLMTNDSVLDPESTIPYHIPGDNRYEQAKVLLSGYGARATVADAFSVLRTVRQKEPWATRVSFVYTARESAVYYCENCKWTEIQKISFA